MYFFFNDTATTEIYTLSLHDALPIFLTVHGAAAGTYWLYVGNRGPQIESISYQITLTTGAASVSSPRQQGMSLGDRKSTRLNQIISYAVFCLKKKSQSYY